MAIELTRYAASSRDVLGTDEDDTIPVADGATEEIATNGFYLLVATTACRVRCKAGITDATGGRTLSAGEKEVRSFNAGVVVAVDALA